MSYSARLVDVLLFETFDNAAGVIYVLPYQIAQLLEDLLRVLEDFTLREDAADDDRNVVGALVQVLDYIFNCCSTWPIRRGRLCPFDVIFSANDSVFRAEHDPLLRTAYFVSKTRVPRVRKRRSTLNLEARY